MSGTRPTRIFVVRTFNLPAGEPSPAEGGYPEWEDEAAAPREDTVVFVVQRGLLDGGWRNAAREVVVAKDGELGRKFGRR